ncbi:hypothetical protein Goari_025322, partial [Gossypium aridum]|nr:hypothetical protein [Gossypium aridum]
MMTMLPLCFGHYFVKTQ